MKKLFISVCAVLLMGIGMSSVSEAKDKLEAPVIEVRAAAWNKMHISWDRVEDADGYHISRSETLDGRFERVGVVTSGYSLSFVDDTVDSAKVYYYKVCAYEKSGSAKKNGKKSNVASGYTKPQKTNFTIKCKIYKDKQVLKWNKAAGADGYIIYRAGTDKVYEPVMTISSGDKLRWVDKTVKKNKKYYYKIRSFAVVEDEILYSGYSKVYTRKKIKTGWHYVKGYKLYYNDVGQVVQDVEDIIGPQKRYVLKVNKTQNIVTVYAKDGDNGYIIPVKAFACSAGNPTPTGTFYTKIKYRWKLMVGDTWAQWSTRINGPFLFHSVVYYGYQDKERLAVNAYNILGQTASLGCVRLSAADAKWIYDNCPLKTKVVIYYSDKEEPLEKPTVKKLPSWHTWDPTDPTCRHLCKKKGCH